MPPGFSWVDRPHLAALAQPESADDLRWLRRQGVELLVSLCEDPPPRRWVNDAGLFGLHLPVEDMTAPTPDQLRQAVDAVRRANAAGLGAAVHCAAGLGRTGTVLACYFVDRGDSAGAAVERVRHLRPGSVETRDQEAAVREYARAAGRPG
jgi:atypical dual specificity phosphatase